MNRTQPLTLVSFRPFSRGPWSALAVAILIGATSGCAEPSHQYPSHAPVIGSAKEQLYRYYDQEVVITGREGQTMFSIAYNEVQEA